MKKIPANRIGLAMAIAVVLVVVFVGLLVSGSPAAARARRLDAARVAALRDLAQVIDVHWTGHGRLPAVLDDLRAEGRPYLRRLDPETGEPYEYRALTDSTYELCARFAKESRSGGDDLWAHGSGRCCFALRARQVPQLAPPPPPR